MMVLSKFVRDASGATAVEYGLIASLIAIVLITAAGALGTRLKTTLNHIATNLS